MRTSLAAVAEHSGGEQAAEPGRTPQRLDSDPGPVGKRGGRVGGRSRASSMTARHSARRASSSQSRS